MILLHVIKDFGEKKKEGRILVIKKKKKEEKIKILRYGN